MSDLESNDKRDQALTGAKRVKKGHSWYSRMSKTKKIILWLLALLIVLAIALGVGLGVGLNNNHNNNDDDKNDN